MNKEFLRIALELASVVVVVVLFCALKGLWLRGLRWMADRLPPRGAQLGVVRAERDKLYWEIVEIGSLRLTAAGIVAAFGWVFRQGALPGTAERTVWALVTCLGVAAFVWYGTVMVGKLVNRDDAATAEEFGESKAPRA